MTSESLAAIEARTQREDTFTTFEQVSAWAFQLEEDRDALLAALRSERERGDGAERETERLKADIEERELEAAQVIAALNGGDELQNLMALNNALVRRAESAEADWQAATSHRDRLAEALREAIGHLGAAKVQLINSDDQIIAGHIRDAYELLVKARRNAS